MTGRYVVTLSQTRTLKRALERGREVRKGGAEGEGRGDLTRPGTAWQQSTYIGTCKEQHAPCTYIQLLVL